MRHRIVRAAVVLALLSGTSLALAYSMGPPVSRTGAPAVATIPAEGLCTSCHLTFPANGPGGLLEVLDLPANYVPGGAYPFRVRLSYAHNPADSVAPYKWGFEITAVQAANGRGAGAFVPGGADQQVKSYPPASTSAFKTRTYLEHTSLGTHDGEVGSVEWNCTWSAPAGDSGAVYFFAAGNAANGDELNSSDRIFTAADTVAAGGTTAVESGPMKPYSFELDPGYPNPFTRFTDFTFAVPRDGKVDFAVFDVAGRRIRTLRSGFRKAGFDGLTWWADREDGSPAPAGVYFARLRVEGEKQALTQRVTLTR